MPDTNMDYGAIKAAREGRGFCQKLNKKTGINAAVTVLTDAGLLRTTAAGYRDVIPCFYVNVNTDSDWVEFEIGYTVNADGSGTFTPLTSLFRVESGPSRVGTPPSVTNFPVPIIIDNDDGGAWTVRAQTNDAGASVTFGINGWREEI